MEIKQLIAKGETEKAIDALLAFASNKKDNDLEKQAINLSGRFSALEKKIKSFTITSSNASARIAQINSILLDIVNDLEESSPPELVSLVEDSEETAGLLTKEVVEALEQQQILERLQKIMKRRKFFQDQFDISSDASQKFNLQENIELMDQDISVLKENLATTS